MKRWRKTAVLVGVNLLLTVGLVEGALRLFPTIIPANLLIHFEPKLRSKLAAGRFPTAEDTVAFVRDDGGPPFPTWKPFAEINYSFEDPGTVNTVKMDETGFCNPPDLYNQTEQFDAIAIGDSFTWCTTVRPEDTWSAQLAEVANVSTYNLGKPAIGLYEYLQLLKQFGLEKSPKVVVMNVYEGNDLRDALIYDEYQRFGPTDQATERKDPGFLDRYSYVWNLMQAVMASNRPQADPLIANGAGDDENFRYRFKLDSGDLPFNLENGDLDEVVHARLLTSGQIELDVFSAALQAFVALAEAHDFVPILAYSPSAYTAYADVVEFEQPELGEIMPEYSRQLRAYFAAQAAELDLEFVDLTPVLQAAAPDYTTPEKLLYYQTNRHFTRYGHAVVAKALAKAVSDAVGTP